MTPAGSADRRRSAGRSSLSLYLVWLCGVGWLHGQSSAEEAAGAEVTLRWERTEAGGHRVKAEAVAGLDQVQGWGQEQWQRVFPVRVEQEHWQDDLYGLPMAGHYRIGAASVSFDPAFPLAPGLHYRAEFRLAELPSYRKGPTRTSRFRLAASEATAAAGVDRIFPTAELLPENLLKFYIHFSAPMSRGRVYQHIQLVDGAGREVELPFLELDEELWNGEQTRLTLFIDPGRIKRGVQPLEEVGPALEEGRSYALVIGAGLRDATGAGMGEVYRKQFHVTAADREPPSLDRWRIAAPVANSTDPLLVEFDEPMDHALAHRMIEVVDPDGARMEGVVELGREECRWKLQPRRPWQAGSHELRVQTLIEDLAGNNVGKRFEVDVLEQERLDLPKSVVRRFDVAVD